MCGAESWSVARANGDGKCRCVLNYCVAIVC
jgi:hypothetical protein